MHVFTQPAMAGFCNSADGLQTPDLTEEVPKSSKVSGGSLKYSRFRETVAGDWVRYTLRPRGGGAAHCYLLQSDPAVERFMSLMAANSATHVMILSHDPVGVIVLAVPVISADPATGNRTGAAAPPADVDAGSGLNRKFTLMAISVWLSTGDS
jgi:hypothetical protein